MNVLLKKTCNVKITVCNIQVRLKVLLTIPPPFLLRCINTRGVDTIRTFEENPQGNSLEVHLSLKQMHTCLESNLKQWVRFSGLHLIVSGVSLITMVAENWKYITWLYKVSIWIHVVAWHLFQTDSGMVLPSEELKYLKWSEKLQPGDLRKWVLPTLKWTSSYLYNYWSSSVFI